MSKLAKDNQIMPTDAINVLFAAEGFPPPAIRAFQAAANQTKLAILSRVPGGSCARLIEERYDLKGYFIKAKSCNWGPMAGFLCQLPPFNKSGAEQMLDNARANEKTYQLINKVVKFAAEKDRPPNDAEEVAIVQDHSAGVAFEKGTTPFVHLKISDERRKELVAEKARFQIEFASSSPPGTMYGIAWDRQFTVCAEFFLVQEGALWGLYHGEVFVAAADGWQNFLNMQRSKEFFGYFYGQGAQQVLDNGTTLCRILERIKVETGNTAYAVQTRTPLCTDNAFSRDRLPAESPLRKMFAAFPSGVRSFYPVLGIKNPFPAYQTDGSPYVAKKGIGTDHPRNAVTGDYDLFAVWDLRDGKDEAKGDEIRRASEKGGARYSILANGIRIEVIPGYSALEARETSEDPRWGNASSNVLLAAGVLNSNMATLSPAKVSPNAAFHSDEGGRPGIKALELPVAVFVTLAGDAKKPPGEITNFYRAMITTKDEFLDLLEFLRPTYRLGLHVGWVFDLLSPKEPAIAARTAKLLGLNLGKVKIKELGDAINGKRTTKPAEDVAAVKAALGL
ncbi:MAG: hypothetical protein IPK80_16205 [Nannocystis sp.]|nr:hypothetical protein [Nannocystis sp.]